jgi:hypothetical protein
MTTRFVATLRFVLQLVANLKGRTYATGSFDDDRFDVSECLTTIDDAGFEPGIVACLIMKEIAAFSFGDYAAALEAAQAAGAAMPAGRPAGSDALPASRTDSGRAPSRCDAGPARGMDAGSESSVAASR